MESKENIKIAVAGTGYVGLSIATLLGQSDFLYTQKASNIVNESPQQY